MSCRPTQEGKNFTKYPVSHPLDGNRVGEEWIKGWAQEYKVKTSIVTKRVCSFLQEPVQAGIPGGTFPVHIAVFLMRIHSQTPCLLVDSDRWWHPTGPWLRKVRKNQWHETALVVLELQEQSCYKNCSKNEIYICDCLWLLQIKIIQ